MPAVQNQRPEALREAKQAIIDVFDVLFHLVLYGSPTPHRLRLSRLKPAMFAMLFGNTKDSNYGVTVTGCPHRLSLGLFLNCGVQIFFATVFGAVNTSVYFDRLIEIQ